MCLTKIISCLSRQCCLGRVCERGPGGYHDKGRMSILKHYVGKRCLCLDAEQLVVKTCTCSGLSKSARNWLIYIIINSIQFKVKTFFSINIYGPVEISRRVM